MRSNVFLILMFSISLFSCSEVTNDCQSPLNLKEKNRSINGRVDSIFRGNDHGLLIFLINSKNGKLLYKQSIFMDQLLFSEIEIGDSISKNLNFLDVTIKKPSGIKKTYLYYCPGVQRDTLSSWD